VGKQHRQVEDDAAGGAFRPGHHHAERIALAPAAFEKAEVDRAGITQQFAAVDAIEPQGRQQIGAGRADRRSATIRPTIGPTVPTGTADPEGGTAVGGGTDDGTSVR
jgi:hypothetical protein